MTGAPIATAASICAGSAAMNSDTRMPAAASSPTPARSASRWPAASRPPSVVRSARRSGTMQAACGRSLAGDADHLRRRRHFEIERLCDALLEPGDVVVDDVAAILAQMRGDAVGAGRDRDLGGLHRIGMAPAARIAHGGDVVDVDAEANGSGIRSHDGLIARCRRAEPCLVRSRARRWRPLSSPAIAR